ncbi:MAG: flotillin family protein [Bacteroidota bacterium]
MLENATLTIVVVAAVFAIAFLIFLARLFRKAKQGEALVITGARGIRVAFSGTVVIPVFEKMEIMDITLKTIVISRTAGDGLVCKDNMRADIKVTFFIRVNQTIDDVKQVAQSIGCQRASHQEQLVLLFDAKFSEALKTVGKRFDFVELYNSRDDFKREILNIIGTDLNGYVLDDCAIDYLEQTPLTDMDENNILDSEGIKKIIDLTSTQKIQANHIEKEKEKTLTKQNVEARETVLELEKQLAETEAKQHREVQTVRAREEAETDKVREEERLKAEKAKIATEEELNVAEENKQREILVAQRNKERTDAVEVERVQQAQLLEATEKEKIVELAQIEKLKAVEDEKRKIQDVIRERVAIEKTVVQEEELMKDTRAFAEADRNKKVAITLAEKEAEEDLVKQIKSAEAAKAAAEHLAKQQLIDAQAAETASKHQAEATKTLAEAKAAEAAAIGLSEAQVMEAKASAREKQGEAEASVVESQSEAEAKGIRLKGEAQADADEQIGLTAAKIDLERGQSEAKVIALKADAEEQKGMAEARVMAEKFAADAKGIEQKAEAMQKLDGVGKEHEEFKLRLEQEKEIELARISIQKEIAHSQATVIAEALKAANIDIVGGETMFFDQIVGSITKGKSVDRLVAGSEVLNQVKDTFFQSGTGQNFKESLKQFIDQFGVSASDLKELSISVLLLKLMNKADGSTKDVLRNLHNAAEAIGIGDQKASSLGI